ncbi:MAG: ATP-binding protein [Bacteroidia bacterium]
MKNSLSETERLTRENIELQQHLRKALETIEAIKEGKIDALVVPAGKDVKVYTERTADKTYRILIEKMHEGAVTLGEDGTILYCNAYFANMVRLPLQKVLGTNFEKFIENTSKPGFEFLFKTGIVKAVKREIFLLADDTAIPVLISATNLTTDNNFILCLIITDLTVQNKNQEELKIKTRELEQKNIELQKVNEELSFQNEEREKRAAELRIANAELAIQTEAKEKRAAELSIANKELVIQNKEKEKRTKELSMANKDLTTFTYVSSHDLQEPLRKIQNFVTAILMEDEKRLSETGKMYFHKMRETAKRMQALIEDLLTYSRTKSDDRIFENTNLNLILDEALSDLDEIIKEKNGTVEAKSLGNANVIPFQFRQLFLNLVSNSLKFAQPGIPPHILVESKLVTGDKAINKNLSPKKSYLCISFTDNGIGFDPKYEDRIFEVFQRLHTLDKYKGTGIGLAICKRIVENHHGAITAKGNPGKGAKFDIYIPA